MVDSVTSYALYRPTKKEDKGDISPYANVKALGGLNLPVEVGGGLRPSGKCIRMYRIPHKKNTKTSKEMH